MWGSEDDWEVARESETGLAKKPGGIEASVVSWMLDAKQSKWVKAEEGGITFLELLRQIV